MSFLFGLLVLALDVWAVMNVFKSGASTAAKLLWTLGILVFPILGFVAWFLAGPKVSSRLA